MFATAVRTFILWSLVGTPMCVIAFSEMKVSGYIFLFRRKHLSPGQWTVDSTEVVVVELSRFLQYPVIPIG